MLRRLACAALVYLVGVGCGSVVKDSPDAGPSTHPDGASTDSSPAAAPTLAAFTPDWGSTAGSTHVRITGTGFSAGGVAVMFGANAAQVMVVSDTELVVTTPAGPHMPVAISVTTAGGTATSLLKYRYLAPLYAADGRGGQAGNLYTIDPATGAAVTVGPISYGVTGLALSPQGILYASTTGKLNVPVSLVTIDPYTGTATMIGPLAVAGGAAAGAPDLAFDGTKLLGWHTQTMTTIDVSTGTVTPAAAQMACSGCAIAVESPGVALLVPGGGTTANLHTVNSSTGIATTGPNLSQTLSLDSMTFVGSTLYAAQVTSMTATTLVAINVTSGQVTTVGALPAKIDALEGIPTQPPLLPAGTAEIAPRSPAEIAAPASVPAAVTPAPVRIAGHVHAIADVLALGHDVVAAGRSRRVVPLGALRGVAASARVVLVDESGTTRVASLDEPGLALTANTAGQLKLVDTREGFHKLLAPIVEIRTAR